MSLSIRVQFLAGYSGREWPPSPARLFKSLVSAARAGWTAGKRDQLDGALRWLESESQKCAPAISAPEATIQSTGRRRFVPNNSKNWPTERRINPQKGIDLEPEPILRWEIAQPAVVWYAWPDPRATIANSLREIARRVPSVGKGEDFAVVDVVEGLPPRGSAEWRPTARPEAAPVLEVPEIGCLDVCDAEFRRASDAPALPVAGVRAVRYAREDRSEPLTPTTVLALWCGGRRRSWDARLLRQVVGPVRRLLDEVRGEIVDELAGRVAGSSERERLDALAQRVLVGHDEQGAPVQEPHLAVLPIPSILGPYPDGRIRRIALVGFGCAANPERRAIFDLANFLLHDRELVDNGVETGVKLGTEPDPQWLAHATRRSCSWVSVTPVVQVAKELTSAEWRRLRAARKNAFELGEELARLERRLKQRRTELITRSLTQVVAPSKARLVSVEVIPAGPIAGVHVASHYRVAGYLASTPRFHVRVQFDRPVAGPLSVGRGRHVGLGLFWPEDHSA